VGAVGDHGHEEGNLRSADDPPGDERSGESDAEHHEKHHHAEGGNAQLEGGGIEDLEELVHARYLSLPERPGQLDPEDERQAWTRPAEAGRSWHSPMALRIKNFGAGQP
jgi:hypothetical protein